MKSCRRSRVYLHLWIFLCTLPKVRDLPLMGPLRWCSVWGQGRKMPACSERKWITLQHSFSRVWLSLTYSSRQRGPAQELGTVDWWYLFSREAVSHHSMSSYMFSRCGCSPKRMVKSIETWKKVLSPKLAICPVRWGSPDQDLQPIAFPLSTPVGSLSLPCRAVRGCAPRRRNLFLKTWFSDFSAMP